MNKTTKYLILAVLLCLSWIIIFYGEPLFTHHPFPEDSCLIDIYGNEACADISRDNLGPVSSEINWWGVPPFIGKIGLLILIPTLIIRQVIWAIRSAKKRLKK